MEESSSSESSEGVVGMANSDEEQLSLVLKEIPWRDGVSEDDSY